MLVVGFILIKVYVCHSEFLLGVPIFWCVRSYQQSGSELFM